MQKEERDLRKAFNDYDQTVDVVSCWHALSETSLGFAHFHRFPRFTPGDLTPDFAMTSNILTAEGKRYSAVGSIVCDIKKFPNPYRDSEQEEGDFRPFQRSLEQLARYSTELDLVAPEVKGLRFRDHDIVLLTKSELVDTVYKFLVASGIKRPFHIGRPLVLVEYMFDAADEQERYIFRWKQAEHNSAFAHPTLAKLMVERAQPMKVAPHLFLRSKLSHVFCNDAPPPIYVLVFLWLEVFPGLLDPEQYSKAQDQAGRVTLRLRTSPTKIVEFIRSRYRIPIRTNVIRRCFELLLKMNKAFRVQSDTNEEYEIAYAPLSARGVPRSDGDANERYKANREYGNIFAALIAKVEAPTINSSRSKRAFASGLQGRLF